MYGYIKGVVTNIEPNYIVLENNGIGYIIFVANPYSFKLDDNCLVYLYTKITEDEHLLYGFKDTDEKELFLKLISVKGVGPKMALPMLATGSPTGIMDAIERENILYLKKFPKIGDKVARQIILDLKGKLVKSDNLAPDNEELISALEGLGYKKDDIKKVLPNIDKSQKIEEKIREALRLLLK